MRSAWKFEVMRLKSEKEAEHNGGKGTEGNFVENSKHHLTKKNINK